MNPSGSSRIVAALDVASADEALALARTLQGAVGLFKIGLELFTAEGPALVREVARLGPVFLDLKLHDIPNTVEAAAREAARLGVAMFTVHASAGSSALRAAVRGAGSGQAPRVLAVTVLTSLEAVDLDAIGLSGSPTEAVLRLGQLALEAGVGGLVCSPLEVAPLRARFGNSPLLVVPGVRPAGTEAGDQRRASTPRAALTAGADLLVIGRPLREAPDPRAAALAIAAELD